MEPPLPDSASLRTALQDRYLIERELGAGGMATVYLAQDLRHDRKVAVKVLRPELSATLGAERFAREIAVVAKLQHPNILPLLDSGTEDGFFYFVMPYIEGDSLRDRLARSGELPIPDAVRIVAEVADALAHAHARGVVHRDIKPENIMLSGRHAVVMDFGVAKAVSVSTGATKLTTAGVALGTPLYMAPEQATADPRLDHRVDIYALGVLAYELLTGRAPLQGPTPQAVLAAHLTETPDPIEVLRPGISPELSRVVMKCLAKHAADRWQTADELVQQLEPLATPTGGMTPTQTRPARGPVPGRRFPRWAIAGIGLVLAGAAGWRVLDRPPATAALMHPIQLTRNAGVQGFPRIASDGKTVAYLASDVGDSIGHVEVRRGTDGSAVRVTDQAGPLGWSPGDDRLLISTPRGLESVPALGGAATLLVAGARYGAWSPDGQRLVYRRGDSVQVRSEDGRSTPLAVATDPHSFAWSPDGRWIAYVSGNSAYLGNWNIAPSSLWLIPAAGGAALRLTAGEAFNFSPVWAPDGRQLLFVSDRDGVRDIYQLALDSRGRPRGEPVRITVGLNASMISLSPDGAHLAYWVVTNRTNIWRLRIPATGWVSSRAAERVTTDEESIESFSISRDGQWLVFDSDRAGSQQLFRRRLAGGEVQQITRGAAPAFYPSLSPDGKEVVYHAVVDGHRRIFVTSADGTGEPVQISPGTFSQETQPTWSPDGRRLAWWVTGGHRTYWVSRTTQGWSAPHEIVDQGTWASSDWIDSTRLVTQDTAEQALVLLDTGRATAPPRTLLSQSAPLGRLVGPSVLSADQRTLIVQGGQALWLLPVQGAGVREATPREVVRFDDLLLPSGAYRGVAAHGGYLYFTLRQPQSSIWVAEVTGLER